MDIWFAELPMQEGNNGVQQGGRPVIITQNNTGNLHSPTVTVIVGTTKNKNNQPTHVKLDKRCGLKEDTVFMAEQRMTINKSKLLFYIGRVPGSKQKEIERAIKIQEGLLEPFDEDYILELIADIIEIDNFFSKYNVTEKESNIRLRRIKELKHYCDEYGYDYKIILEKYYQYPAEVSMCG